MSHSTVAGTSRPFVLGSIGRPFWAQLDVAWPFIVYVIPTGTLNLLSSEYSYAAVIQLSYANFLIARGRLLQFYLYDNNNIGHIIFIATF